ncbi:65-kDa microtubule-associated protein 5-like [Phragmites australis]|uniref:65-kDa microtubule-associated protein 5-like n=1 Tax=Phragmites australis TaxID=29695 RepID=UPI002D78BCAF|nr:65-kDa microtubule-associated protein 5-like [Phragmites australis]
MATPPLPRRVSCGSLLQELQELWGEIGQDEMERNRMILQLEEDCLNVYKTKVDQTRKQKADLLQTLSFGEADIEKILSALGERESFSRSEKLGGTLMEQLSKIEPVLEDLRQRRVERVNEFRAVQLQIVRLQAEISGTIDHGEPPAPLVDESDLSLRRFGELKAQLNELQTEKNLRLQKIDIQIKCINDMCNTMTFDLKEALYDVHPSYAESGRSKSISISNSTLDRLAGKVHSLNHEKKQRLRKLQDLGSTLIELWNLMDTPIDEQTCFDHVTSLIKVSPNTVMPKGCLAHDLIEKVEIEVKRLNHLKASKMKELVLKKMIELEEIYRSVHMDIDGGSERRILNDLIDSGRADLSELLTGMDDRISEAREHALSRKDILEKVEKWTLASEEETWLDEYERDQNRYNAGRGAHKNLKRAEKARTLVSKIPSLLENLTAKIKAWEKEKGIPFMFDKMRLLDTLEEYTSTRQKKDEEKRRSRELKKLQEQFAAEQGTMFGAKPSPIRPLPARKPLGQSSNVNIVGGTPTSRRVSTPMSRKGCLSSGKVKEAAKTPAAPANYVALPKDCLDN